MTRQFIAALLSLSLGFSAMTTAPARADEDVVKVIAGLALLGVIASVANDKKHKKVAKERVHKPQYVQPRRHPQVHRQQRRAHKQAHSFHTHKSHGRRIRHSH
ncbi:MAG: hypothetical protein ABJN34_14755 [Litoreibacter sp.]|uniref:hypothetical protein n=1 Tax=Litoreibacter sp. TaxID=1969459 RepID=UPI00329682DA